MLNNKQEIYEFIYASYSLDNEEKKKIYKDLLINDEFSGDFNKQRVLYIII